MNEQPVKGRERFRAFLRDDVPRGTKIAAIVALAAGILHLLACCHTSIADFLNDTIGFFSRNLLATLTNILPFSVAETALLSLLPLAVLFAVFAVRAAGDRHRFRRLIAILLIIPLALYTVFACTLGFAYRTETLDVKLGLVRKNVSAAELYETAVIVQEEAAARLDKIAYSQSGSSVMPYSFQEMNECLLAAYDRLSEEHFFLRTMKSRVKPVLNSEAMAYAHIAGVYTYMTGEANVNLVFPDYSLVFTSAHELAHQRGIARENEANFVAFLVCIGSEDVYLQYAGYLNMLEYLINALAVADLDRLDALLDACPDELLREMIAYNEIFDQYRDSVVGEISGSINDAYLQSQGTPGTRSYGMVVDLAVAYYR